MPDTHHLRSFGAQLKRWPPVLDLPAGTWNGRAKVTPITGAAGQTSSQRHYEVSASWLGPGLQGLPPTSQPVDATDLVLVDDLELAKAIAMAAVDELRARRAPDLRALERRFREHR